MKKIPTLFVRDQKTHKVINKVVPGCGWVLRGEGTPTRKYDGTCVRFDGNKWWARRGVKAGKTPPEMFVKEDYDELTRKTVGWVPASLSDWWPLIVEASAERKFPKRIYELVGPKVNGNPEGYETHELIPHGEFTIGDAPRTFDALRDYLTHDFPFEGIVWHHENGRMAKLKVKDF